jgi:hypothetical protein
MVAMQYVHFLQGHDFTGIPLPGKEHLAVSTLANLTQDGEILASGFGPAFAQIGALSAAVVLPGTRRTGVEVRSLGKGRVCRLERFQSPFSIAKVG